MVECTVGSSNGFIPADLAEQRNSEWTETVRTDY